MSKKPTKFEAESKRQLTQDSQNWATSELSKRNRSSTAGKGDRNSAAWINSPKYQRSMEANEAYARGEITLDEWRFIVHGIEPKGQGEN